MADINKLIADRYQLLDVLGKGGQAIVYRAIDQQTRRAVAVKRLNAQASRDPAAVVRIAREQQALRQLAGTHAVELLDVSRDGTGAICLVMELLEGIDLEKELGRLEQAGELMPLERTIEVMDPIVRTLEKAHSVGIMHRDLKPANVFLLKPECGGGARLLDFGFARLRSSQSITRAGYVMGSPNYIAPEMWRGEVETADTRVDIYALGVILFRLLSGRLPFEQESLLDKLHAVTRAPRPSLHALRPALPKKVDNWVERALAIAPDDRFSSAQNCWDELLRSLEVRSGSSRVLAEGDEASDLRRIRQWLEAPVVASTSAVQAALRSATETFRRWMGSLRPLEAPLVTEAGPAHVVDAGRAVRPDGPADSEQPTKANDASDAPANPPHEVAERAPDQGRWLADEEPAQAAAPTQIRIEPLRSLRIPPPNDETEHTKTLLWVKPPSTPDVPPSESADEHAETLLWAAPSNASATNAPVDDAEHAETLLWAAPSNASATDAPVDDAEHAETLLQVEGPGEEPARQDTRFERSPAQASKASDTNSDSIGARTDELDDFATQLDVRLQAACEATSLALTPPRAPRGSPAHDSATTPSASNQAAERASNGASDSDAAAPSKTKRAKRTKRSQAKPSKSDSQQTESKPTRGAGKRDKRKKSSQSNATPGAAPRSSARTSSKKVTARSEPSRSKRRSKATTRTRKAKATNTGS